MEEASSFWNKGLTWRSFVACMIAAAVVKAAKTGFRKLDMVGFIEFPDSSATFELKEFVPFAAIAVGTSLLGALFCASVERLARCRFSLYRKRGRRRRRVLQVLEAVLVAAITVTVCFWVPVFFGCSRLT